MTDEIKTVKINLEELIDFEDDSEYIKLKELADMILEDEDDEKPSKERYRYDVSLCFAWMDFDSCITFDLELDKKMDDDGDKKALIYDLIQSYDGLAEMEDGTVVNLDRFVQSYVKLREWEMDIDDEPKKKPVLRLVH